MRDRLDYHGLRGNNEVYDVPALSGAFADHLDRGDRYQSVDVYERGQLRLSVVE